jgi:hypothetical protein
MARKSKYKVVCGSRTMSHHRKKSAARKAAPKGCHVSLGGLGSPKGRKHRGGKRIGRRLGRR